MLQKIRKYIKLYVMLFKTSFIADLEYRVNFATRILVDILWYFGQIVTFEVIYQHTDKIGDWNVMQMRVFLGIVFLVDALYMIIFSENLDSFSEKVRRGDLDLALAKPVSSQFLLSLQKASTAMIGNFVLAVSWLGYSLSQYAEFEWARLLWLIVLIPCGLCSFYCLRFILAGSAVIFAKSDNLQFIWYQISRLGMRPDSMYVPWFRWAILTVLPVGMIASVPARAILEPPQWGLFAWCIILSGIILFLTTRFWKFALKHYSSASS